MKHYSKQATNLLKGLFISTFIILIACGKDSETISAPQINYQESSSSKQKSSSSVQRTSVKTTFELGVCEKSNISEQLYVSEKSDYYTCSYVNGEYTWMSMKESSSSTKPSSSSTAEFEYLTKSKTMKFTLKYYRQTVCSLEGKGKKNCNYADGNPNVSFTIDFIQPGGSKTTFSTKESINKKWFEYDDLGEWEGELSFTTEVPALTSTIKVCPKVVDVDALLDDDISSGYCYSKSNVGQLPNKEVVEQSDTRADKYELEWEWYLD